MLASTYNEGFLRDLRGHYTRSAGPPPGKKMAWLAHEDGEPVGYFGLGEPSFKLAPRRRLGLEDARPLEHTVSCFIWRRFLRSPTRGSAFVREWHRVAGQDWERRYGWLPVHWETMVLPSAVESVVPGACFRRAGYRSLGMTTGRTARRPSGHTGHKPFEGRAWEDSEPKLVLYRGPLARLPRG